MTKKSNLISEQIGIVFPSNSMYIVESDNPLNILITNTNDIATFREIDKTFTVDDISIISEPVRKVKTKSTKKCSTCNNEKS